MKETSSKLSFIEKLKILLDSKVMRTIDWIVSLICLAWSISLFFNSSYTKEFAIVIFVICMTAVVITALNPREFIKKRIESSFIHRKK